MTEERFDLGRFVQAQDASDTYEHALAELRRGKKQTHWMWFVFPQFAGLGQSAMSRRYAISSLEEARRYLADGVLGARLRACVDVLLARPAGRAIDIFGPVDSMKLRSSMTLFSLAEPQEERFQLLLERYFGGELDALTERLAAR